MEDFSKWMILQKIDSPDDLKALPQAELSRLSEEIRAYLVYRVSENGGHLASNLGVVELTMAIHRIFSVPKDHVIFDVGHQSYVHKLLTGRKAEFDSLRELGGISGFTRRAESDCDAFGAGHSSTAISAAIGFAEAERLKGSDAYTVAVVGDGALSGGLSYEGLDNCRRNLKLIIVINENEMSISRNSGRLADHLSHIRSSKKYIKTKAFTSSALRHIPLLGKPMYLGVRGFKRWLKHRFYDENIFEHMGIRYMGPIDGNDLDAVTTALERARKLNCSVILHLKTKKGKGYLPAEQAPNCYHSLAPHGTPASCGTFSEKLGEYLGEMAERDQRICAITAAMSDGTGLSSFAKIYPKRFFDVGIAEGHATTFAAGLAADGMHPVFAVYSTFLQRAYDNVLHDVALQHLPVVFCIDRAGLNARDGVTHHGIYDVPMLSVLPDFPIYAPMTFEGLRRALECAVSANKPAAIRYPSGGESAALTEAFYREASDTPLVRMWQNDKAPSLTVVTYGRIAEEALAAADELKKEGITMRILLCEQIAPYEPLTRALLPMLAGGGVIFLEEGIRHGGFAESLASKLYEMNGSIKQRVQILAIENGFDVPKKGEGLYATYGIDRVAVMTAARAIKGGRKR